MNCEQVYGSPFVVIVKHRQYRPELSFGQQGSNAGMLSKPWGVAVNEHDEIAVTGSFGRKGDKNREFKFPCGIGC